MAFCTACGTQVPDTSKFCTNCGKPLPAIGAPAVPVGTGITGGAMAPAGTSPTAGGSNALKIALIIIAVVVGLGIMGAIIAGIAVHRIARHSRVITTDGGAKVVTPFGTVQTTTDVSKISGALGGDVYPGASMSEGGSDVNMGGRHVVSANLSTSDSPDKVADYYKQKYPRSIITDAEGKHSIVYKDDDRMVTIAIEPEGGRTLIHISRISRQ